MTHFLVHAFMDIKLIYVYYAHINVMIFLLILMVLSEFQAYFVDHLIILLNVSPIEN